MSIINSKGEITILDSNGTPTPIGTIKHGIFYSKEIKARKVARVSIQPSHVGLTDEFYFIPGENNYELVFQHIMNRDINPELMKTYLVLLSEDEKYSPMEFIQYIIKNYFVKELGYQFSEEIQTNN